MYLPYLHSFRAVAILLIVLCHSQFAFDWSGDSVTYRIFDQALANTTFLFVFVSGFLFEHLSASYDYLNYLLRKLKFVILPYLFCSIPAIIYSAMLAPPFEVYPFLAEWSLARRILWFYAVGGAHLNSPLWYIPMASLFFLAAPLFIQFRNHPHLYYLLPLLVLFSLFAHRPGTEVFYLGYGPANAAYFAPVYVLGMWSSANRERIERYLPSLLAPLLIAYLAFSTLQYFVQPYDNIYMGARLFSQEHGLIDYNVIRMFLSCYLIMAFAYVWSDRMERPMIFIGTSSFTIYFVHYYFLILWRFDNDWIDPPVQLISVLTLFAVMITGSCVVAWAFRKLLGRNSRLLVGS